MGYKQSPINFGKGTGSFGTNSPLKANGNGHTDEWYEKNPRDKSGDQEGVEYDRDGRVVGGFENFESEAYYDHDKGKNTATDRWGKTYSPGGGVYTYDEAGKAAFAKDQSEDFGIRGKNKIEEGWASYMEGAPNQTPDVNTGPGSGMGGVQGEEQMIDQNTPNIDVVGSKPGGSGGSGGTKNNNQRANQNYRDAVELGTHEGDSHLSWRQKMRLKAGGGKSDRQLKRLKRQEARKSQRAKNRRERGWGGFGWNRPR